MRSSPWLTAAAVSVAVLALLPLSYLVLRAFEPGLDVAAQHLWRARTAELLLSSVGLVVAVTTACLLIGVPAAWLAVRSDLPLRRLFGVLFMVPLAIPSYVGGFTWISEWPGLAGFGGAFIVLTLVSFPYVYLPVAAALTAADPALEEVSRSLGKRALRTFVAVTLRQVRPAALAGGLLVALYVLSDFGAVSLMRFDVFTTSIYTSYQASFDKSVAALLGCVLVVLALGITVAERRARGKAALLGMAAVGSGASRAAMTVPLGPWRPVALLTTLALLAAAIGVPVWSLLSWLTGRSAELDLPDLVAATGATVEVSALGALATVVLALPVGVLVVRHRSRLARGVELAAYAGHALPGITIGLAVVFAGIRAVPVIYHEAPLTMLVFAYAVLFLPLAIGAVRVAMSAAPVRLEEVSRSLGKSMAATRVRVMLPLTAPGIAAGAALVFLTCAKELPVTLLLSPTGTDTLATELWSKTGVGEFGAAAPYAAMLVVVAALPALFLGNVLGQRGGAG